MHIGPQRIEIRAVANDYKPGRTPVESSPYYIVILDKTEHAKLVQREFDPLVEKLEELQRAEETLFDHNEQLRKEVENARNPAEQAEKLAEQEQAERRNTAAMQKLQDDLAKLTKEALRNDQIGADVVAKWAELVEQLRQLAQSSMPKVSAALNQAQSSQSTGDQQTNTRQALQQQEEVLKQMAAALQQMNQAGELMQAGNFVNRLRKMAALEKTIGAKLSALFPQTIGATIDQIPPPLRLQVQRIGDQQYQAQQGVQTIRDELGSFVIRTQQEKYRNVHREMLDRKVVEDLERLTGLLDKKVSQDGIEGAQKWSAQLETWAQMLQPAKSNDSGGGGGGGGGQMPPEVMAALMQLMRIRMGEEDLRSHTGRSTRAGLTNSIPHWPRVCPTNKPNSGANRPTAGQVLKQIKGVPVLLAGRYGDERRHVHPRPAANGPRSQCRGDRSHRSPDRSAGEVVAKPGRQRGRPHGHAGGNETDGGGNQQDRRGQHGGVSERDNVPTPGNPPVTRRSIAM